MQLVSLDHAVPSHEGWETLSKTKGEKALQGACN